jgi:5-formyltetrahydrofolate cyclo-ligase
MSADVHALKVTIRNQLRAKSKSVPASERAACSAKLCALLQAQLFWQKARSVLFYFPMALEPDIWPLLDLALAAGKRILLPRFVSQQNDYEVREIHDELADLETGQFHITEPKVHCSVFPLNQLDLALVPGLGFDLNGGRLGRGQGYYDRLLARVSGHKCGVAFDWQLVKEIPWEPHDIRVNSILTPTRWQIVVS